MNVAQPRIVILGAGFGGLYTTLDLVKRLRRAHLDAEITLLDRNNYFLFSPLLHEVTVDMVGVDHVVHPVRQFLRGMPVAFHETTVEAVDLEQRLVQTGIGDFPYDYLVLGLGSVTNYFGNPTLAYATFPLKTLGDAYRLRNHLITMFETASAMTDPEQRRQALTFVQVGAGYTGIEIITEIHDLFHESLLPLYPNIRPDEIRMVLLDALPALPSPSNAQLAASVMQTLTEKGIDVHFNAVVKDCGRGWLETATGERIATNTVIWAAGVTTNPVLAALQVPHGPQKRVQADSTLALAGYPGVFAIGDCACVLDANGKPLPMTAQVANQQAPVLAENLVRAIQGKPLKNFTYHRLGELASLGTYNAVADLGPVKLKGFLAWWIWRTVYLAKMPWWGDKFRIAADWTLDLFFPRDTSRIEITSCAACPNGECPGQRQRHDEK